MALPNMAMIPSGYKPTKLYSVLPTPSYGSEEITNGSFDTDSDWTYASGVVISGGSANITNLTSASALYQSASYFTVGVTYSITYTISNYSSGRIVWNDFGSGGGVGVIRQVNGTYTETYTKVGSSGDFGFQTTIGFTGSIDNVSVQEVFVGNADFDVLRATPATRVNQQGLIETPEFIIGGEKVTNGDFSDGANDWTLGTGWSVSGGKAECIGNASHTTLTQSEAFVGGKTYKVTFDIVVDSGNFVIQLLGGGSDSGNTISSTQNKYTEYIKASANRSSFGIRSNDGNGIGSIDNISIIEVERNNIPRLDYTDGTCPVLLTEPQSTNLITQSETFSNSSWSNLGSRTLITDNNVISPDGTQNASKMEQILSTNNAPIRFNGLTSGVEYTLSLYAKKGNYDNIQLDISDINTAFTLTDDWVRYEITETSVGAFVDIAIRNGSIGDYFYIWGAQVEELPYSTSIIPTNGSAVTRNKDIVNNAGTSATYNSTEGVLFVETILQGDGARRISLSDGTNDNRILLNWSSDTNFSASVNVGGVGQATLNYASTFINVNRKYAFKYKENDFSLWVDGTEVATDTSGTTFPNGVLSSFNFDLTGSNNFEGKTSQVQVFNTALSDFDLQNLTSNATAYATYETMRTSLNFNIQ